ncbi:MAG: four helix bundle protein [Bacteroidetes bacterium]|nr:four helix bundle protein [Bacteroidota bacterium]
MSNSKNINSEVLRQRTKLFAIEIVRLISSFPKNTASFVVGNQLCKSGTSLAANYRAATRARSDAEFYSKICICVEEADETVFWLEIIDETGLTQNIDIEILKNEATEILSILASTKKTLKLKQQSKINH